MLVLGLSSGHGGNDPGTEAGRDRGIVEAEFALELVEQLHERLPSDVVRVERLNDPGETIGPSARAQRAAERGCQLVLAVHVNEGQGGAHGGHMLYRAGDTTSKRIADAIARAWPSELRREHLYPVQRGSLYVAGAVEPATRGLWPRAHSLLSAYQACPTVLVEAFYVSSWSDCSAARQPLCQLGMVGAMLCGVSEAGRLLCKRV